MTHIKCTNISTWLLAVISSRRRLRIPIGNAFDVRWWRMEKTKSWHNTMLRYSSTWCRFPACYHSRFEWLRRALNLHGILGNFGDLTRTPNETFWSRIVIAVTKLSTSRLEREVRLFFYTRVGRRDVRAISPSLLNRNTFSRCYR